MQYIQFFIEKLNRKWYVVLPPTYFLEKYIEKGVHYIILLRSLNFLWTLKFEWGQK